MMEVWRWYKAELLIPAKLLTDQQHQSTNTQFSPFLPPNQQCQEHWRQEQYLFGEEVPAEELIYKASCCNFFSVKVCTFFCISENSTTAICTSVCSYWLPTTLRYVRLHQSQIPTACGCTDSDWYMDLYLQHSYFSWLMVMKLTCGKDCECKILLNIDLSVHTNYELVETSA